MYQQNMKNHATGEISRYNVWTPNSKDFNDKLKNLQIGEEVLIDHGNLLFNQYYQIVGFDSKNGIDYLNLYEFHESLFNDISTYITKPCNKVLQVRKKIKSVN